MSFPIEDAAREGAKIVVGVAGPSGSGKTYSAILLGYGLAGKNGSKLGLLDTENRRGRLYADILPNGEKFKIADFLPPFSPARYIDGIRAFEEAGCEVLVIDSLSHSWEGIGGCEEIATAGNPKTPRWNKAKLENRRMINALLQSSMHIIVCVRAREKVKIEFVDGKQVFIPLGFQPVTEKNTMFEMTASLMMHDEGKNQDVLKCPKALKGILGRGNDYITIEDGVKLREWILGGTPVNREEEQAKAALATAAETGLASLSAAWAKLPKPMQNRLVAEKDAYKASAEAYDKQKAITDAPDQEW
jgi:AAA domain